MSDINSYRNFNRMNIILSSRARNIEGSIFDCKSLIITYNFIDIIVVILILFISNRILINIYIQYTVINHRKEKILSNESFFIMKWTFIFIEITRIKKNTKEKDQLIISISSVSKSREASAVSLSNRRLVVFENNRAEIIRSYSSYSLHADT